MIYRFGGYRIDTTRFELAHQGRALPVEPQVLELLIMLLDNRDRVVTRDELLDRIWKGRIVSDTTLSSRIKTARQVIGDDGRTQGYIRTIHGRGFRFVGAVESEDPLPPAAAGEPVPAARPVTRYARSGDIHIAYQLFGEGPVNLVLAPGFVSHIDNYWDNPDFNRWLTRLGGMARVAMFDKRGTGLSDRVSALPGMDERMDDLRAVMDAVGFDSACIMGISEGGSLATLFTAYHPARCDSLILYGSFAQFRYWFADEASLRVLFDYIESDWGSGKSLPWFAPSVAGDAEFIRWWGKFERLGATPGAVRSLMQMNSRIDISHVLPSIQVPTLVIHVSDDVLIDIAGGRELAANIPDARYVELPGRDHLPMTENAAGILDAVEDFLGQAPSRARPSRVLATLVLVQSAAAGSGTLDEDAACGVRETLLGWRASRVSSRGGCVAATFDRPARALEGAVAASRRLRRDGVSHRIGVHTGEVGFESGMPEGTAVNIAGDVAAHAYENEILASRTVNDLVAGSGIVLVDRGPFTLPAIDQRWHLFRVGTGNPGERPAAAPH